MEPEGSLPHSQVPTTCLYPISEYIHENSHFMHRMKNYAIQLNPTERPTKHA
jgi:hypothetical protein